MQTQTIYNQVKLNNDVWVITEAGHDYKQPKKAITMAFDTETLTYIDGQIKTQKQMFSMLKDNTQEEKRARLSVRVWAWQCYDEVNGFFMTNDFTTWLEYQGRAGARFVWCYNATFDFSQIDYKILAEYADVWKPHEHKKGKGYIKAQPWTYESLHNDAGARYAYKLWLPVKKHGRSNDRHEHVHAIEYRDLMKLIGGGLAAMLEGLNVCDNDGQPIRKLTMDYQAVNDNELTNAQIDYCCNDVKGLYFAIKQFNTTIEEQSNNELHIFGKDTNIMTAGGFAKCELLRSIYPELKNKRQRIKRYQREHPITQKQDQYFRQNYLYRGGITFLNPAYKGKLLKATKRRGTMQRYDVNSEYPFAMSVINDLIGKPVKIAFNEYLKGNYSTDEYEAIFVLNSVVGRVKPGFCGVWYDPLRKDYTDVIDEEFTHLIFKRELDELTQWYDIDFACDWVILFKKGAKIYAPYVYKNYELKAAAKKAGNKVLQQVSKLNLNSSYGKLAERIERRKGHYELNADTGAIHFVVDGTETDSKAALSVVIGALITCVARVYILSKIREVCGYDKNGTSLISRRFIYIDTDSIHAFAEYEKANAYTLGGLKLEARCEAVKYIAPKTYIDIEKVNNNHVDIKDVEVHTKGINVSAVMLELQKRKTLTLNYINNKINYGAKYNVLTALNVRGGKALIPVAKYLARPEMAPNLVINNGYYNEI